jgi:hypothetical protein
MGKIKYVMRVTAFLFVASSCMMCSKNDIKTEAQRNAKKIALVSGEALEIVTTCTYTVQPNPNGLLMELIYLRGSVICIPAGTRGALLLKNFKGTAANPNYHY